MGFAEGTPTELVELGGQLYEIGWTWAAKRRVRECLLARHADPAAVHEEENLAAALWAALDKEARTALTLDDVEEMINPANEVAVAGALRALIIRSEPEPDPNVKPGAVTMPTPGLEKKSASTSSGRLESTISV